MKETTYGTKEYYQAQLRLERLSYRFIIEGLKAKLAKGDVNVEDLHMCVDLIDLQKLRINGLERDVARLGGEVAQAWADTAPEGTEVLSDDDRMKLPF